MSQHLDEYEDKDAVDGSNSPDELDRASARALKENEEAVRQAREKLKPEQVQNADGSWPEPDCIDCGEPNPEARLQLGKVRCVECQTLLEKKNGFFKR